MIIITGAAGFIGSYITGYFNQLGHKDLILVDDFSKIEKESNLRNKEYLQLIDREDIFDFIEKNNKDIEFIFHLGARTDTSEFDINILDNLNTSYTKKLWSNSVKYQISFIYASSGATYGDGSLGFSDDDKITYQLKPLNPYGDSKHIFDIWALKHKYEPPYWVGLKFFNVFGPNEYHKSRMASVPFHIFNTLKNGDKVKIFKSHKEEYSNGGQMRDFIYVKDIARVFEFLYNNKIKNGIYNLGSGNARTFMDLTKACHKSFGKDFDIDFIDIPLDIRESYQYYTQANMNKLINSGYNIPFTSLEDAIDEYYKEFLLNGRIF